jgi:hypothetical protein
MKTFLLCLSTMVASCSGADIDSIRATLSVGSNAMGAFISTNRAYTPFYIVTTNLDLSNLVGAKWDQSVVSHLRHRMISQYTPSMKSVERRHVDTGYITHSGRYAVLNAQSITLASFEIEVSDANGTKGVVLSARLDLLILPVDSGFLEKAEKLRRSHPKSE